MARQQLPPQIKKIAVLDRKTGKKVVRYRLTIDAGVNPETGKRQVRRHYATEKEARDALAEITQQAATDSFVPPKAVTVEELCGDWLASLHNARATTINGYTYCLAPLRNSTGICCPEANASRPGQAAHRAWRWRHQDHEGPHPAGGTTLAIVWYGAAPSGRAAGGDRQVARPRRRRDHGADLRAFPGRCAACGGIFTTGRGEDSCRA
jgi:hypothetical protein